MIIVLVIIGGCYATFEIIRDRYPDAYNEFITELKKLKFKWQPGHKKEYVGKHTPKKTRKPTQVKTRR
jgi:hypothetical protein